MLLDNLTQIDMLVNAARIDETSAEKGVVPVKNDRSLVLFRFLLGGQPNLLVGKIAKKLVS